MAEMQRRLVAGLSAAGAVIVLDQLSKFWVVAGVRLPETPGRRIELSPVFDLTFVENRGVSFGLLQAGGMVERWGLILLSLAISGFFLAWLRTAERRLTALALGLVIGGAVGNVIDRLRFGYVVDFLDFSGLWFPWVFNVADAAITIGAALLMLDYLVAGEARAKAETP